MPTTALPMTPRMSLLFSRPVGPFLPMTYSGAAFVFAFVPPVSCLEASGRMPSFSLASDLSPLTSGSFLPDFHSHISQLQLHLSKKPIDDNHVVFHPEVHEFAIFPEYCR